MPGEAAAPRASLTEYLLTFGARHRLFTAVVLLLLSVLSVSQLSKIVVDTSYDSLMRAKDPGRLVYDNVVAKFGSDNTTIIYLRSKDLFTRERLTKIENLTDALQALEGVTRVESLFTVRNVQSADGGIETGPLLDGVPPDARGLAKARADALRNPLILGNLLSRDGTVTAVNVTVGSETDDLGFNQRFRNKVDALLGSLKGDFEEVFQIGSPRLNNDIEQAMFSDLKVLTPLSTAVILVCLFLMLRLVLGAVEPMLSAGLSILWTFGFMGALGFPLTILTAIVPSLVIVIGCAEDTHLISEYMHGIAATRDRQKAIHYMARKIGLPIFINSATTALGFFSNAITDIALIQQFSYVTGFAMLANLVSTVLVVPLSLSLVGPRRPAQSHAEEGKVSVLTTWLAEKIIVLTDRHATTIIVCMGVVITAFGALATTVRVNNDPLSYFRRDAPIVRDSETVHRDLSGMQIFYIALTADRPDAFRDPAYLKKVEAVQRYLDKTEQIDKSVSLADHVAWVNREMHGGEASFLNVPSQDGLISQYLLMFQRADLEPYVTADYRSANIVVRHNISASEQLNAVIAGLAAALPPLLGESVSFQITGRGPLVNAAAESLFTNEVYSLFTLLMVIFLIMFALFTSFRAGVVSLIPNIIPMVILFGTMGLFGISLNPGTATVAAVALGIAVDDTTHFMARYNLERKLHPDHTDALRVTLMSELLPVITTSFALAVGFGVLIFSNFTIVLQFGVLAAMTMILAMLVDLMVTPILLGRVRIVTLWDMIGLKVGHDLLTKSPLFAGMSKWEIRKTILLAGILKYDQGVAIVEQGARGGTMYLILHGEVEVAIGQRSGAQPLARLGPGEVFGEIGFGGERTRSATVIATQPTELVNLEQTALARTFRFHPFLASKFYRNLARILGARLAERNEPRRDA